MGQIGLIKGLLLTSLFTIGIVVFSISFGTDNNAATLLSEDPDYAELQDGLVGDVQNFNVDSNSSADTFMSTTQDTGDQSASSGGQFKVVIGTAVTLATTVLTIGFNKIFGIDTGFGIFLTVVTSLLVWIGVLYGWKSWKGNPD